MDLIEDESDEGDAELQRAIAESLRDGRLIEHLADCYKECPSPAMRYIIC